MSRRGWVGKHAATSGSCYISPPNQALVKIEIENHSRWASQGDPDKVIDQSIQGRQIKIEKNIEYRLNKIWGYSKNEQP